MVRVIIGRLASPCGNPATIRHEEEMTFGRSDLIASDHHLAKDIAAQLRFAHHRFQCELASPHVLA